MHKITFAIGASAAAFVLVGAGCNSKPVDTSYQQQANEYQTQSNTTIASSTGSNTAAAIAATTSPTAVKKPATVKKPAVKPAPVAPSPLSASAAYLKALDTYKKAGLYLEFTNCHGLPGSLSVKKGTGVMLDNRDNKGHTFGFENKLYGAGSYRYVIVTPQHTGTDYITCDGGGAAQLLVQP
jgi:hypothetical protein